MDIKEIIKRFFSSKMNIAMVVVQFIAIVFFLISGVSLFCYVAFFVLEGVFLILLGVNLLFGVSKIKKNQESYYQLPYTPEQVQQMTKSDERKIKSHKFTGIVLIIVGIFVIFNALFTI